MRKILNVKEIQEALDRAAYNALHGSQSIRAGRFDDGDAAQHKAIAQSLRQILREQGFGPHKTRGDLEIWRNSLTDKSLVVPTHICRHNANALLIHAGLPKAF